MTFEEYLAHVAQLIQTNLNPLRGYITVAVLGERLKRSNLEVSWKTFGFSSLLRLLEALEQRNLVVLKKTEKDALAVAPATPITAPSSPTPPVSESSKTYNALRKAVWAAFVFTTPEGRRFIHRLSGSVRLGLQEEPTPVDEWSEIQPIPEAAQKEWATSFAGHDPALLVALRQADWHRAFPGALAGKGHSERAAWNRHRSLMVSRSVDEWALTNTFPRELLFEHREMRAPDSSTASDEYPSRFSDDQVRKWLLAAIAQLPTEQLLAIPLTGQLLLSAFRSDGSMGAKA